MECLNCGAPNPANDVCTYCGWAPEETPESEASAAPAQPSSPTTFKDLIENGQSNGEPGDLLEQVPEDMRGVLAARLKASEEEDPDDLSDQSRESLRNQGFRVVEDARGSRISSDSPAQNPDLSAFQVVSLAAEQEGGVQPQTKLPMCPACQSASPVGSTHCQWCAEPLP